MRLLAGVSPGRSALRFRMFSTISALAYGDLLRWPAASSGQPRPCIHVEAMHALSLPAPKPDFAMALQDGPLCTTMTSPLHPGGYGPAPRWVRPCTPVDTALHPGGYGPAPWRDAFRVCVDYTLHVCGTCLHPGGYCSAARWNCLAGRGKCSVPGWNLLYICMALLLVFMDTALHPGGTALQAGGSTMHMHGYTVGIHG